MGRTDSESLLLAVAGPDSGESEVTELDVPAFVDEDVGAFEVAVEDVFGVEVGHAESNILEDVENLLLAQQSVRLVQVVEQTALVHEFCHHSVLVVVNAHA